MPELLRTIFATTEARRHAREFPVLRMDAQPSSVSPDGPLMIYFFNPFHISVMERVLNNLSQSLASSPRRVTLVCNASYHREAIMQILLSRQNRAGFRIFHLFEFCALYLKRNSLTVDSLIPYALNVPTDRTCPKQKPSPRCSDRFNKYHETRLVSGSHLCLASSYGSNDFYWFGLHCVT